ncbi:asparagine synthase-related protein [Hanstruepera flava]|uniref:asparagine synthase-related protein n=1 Tax=Hanstruepera flava TaxID=2930218 RepID=UPI0020276FED|nr:asparagine synthetase B family protein [Hanstruepera flava]
MTLSLPILPNSHTFAKQLNEPHELDFKSICVFIAAGFFMGSDTYWKDTVCLLPGHDHELDTHGFLLNSNPNFKWHYSPNNMSFDEALEAYITLFKSIVAEQVGENAVILPLSGGLDSRSQALILKQMDNPVHAFSYAFEGGYPEHHISKQIAAACDFSFEQFDIKKGYLWEVIEDLAAINGCYSEFTHPRQMAVLSQLKQMQGVFSLGHWGDVLFDRGVPEGTREADVIPLLLKKMIKPQGLILAEQLWETWGLTGDFKTYLIDRISTDLNTITIDNISAKVRAYKTSHWAHRWTTTNLSVFTAAHPITLPYYDTRMCSFICTVPEDYLADRRLQIAHLQQDKSLSRITWQAQKPFNLQNYHYNKVPYNIPYRAWSKFRRTVQELIGNPYIQRNWELQFLGADNRKYLEDYLFDSQFNKWIPKSIVNETYNRFLKEDPLHTAHAVSMLLTLSVWYNNCRDNEVMR